MQLHFWIVKLFANDDATWVGLDQWKIHVTCIFMWLSLQLGAAYCLLRLKFYGPCLKQLGIVASRLKISRKFNHIYAKSLYCFFLKCDEVGPFFLWKILCLGWYHVFQVKIWSKKNIFHHLLWIKRFLKDFFSSFYT
jgi:hypothetical protein